MSDYSQILNTCNEKLQGLLELIPTDQYKRRLAHIDEEANNPNLWNDPKKAGTLMKERQKLSDIIDKIADMQNKCAYFIEFNGVFPDDIASIQDQIDLFCISLDAFE